LSPFKWSGSLDQGVAKLAQSVGYTFYVTAPPGAQPLLVTVELANVPAYEVFKALGEEAGTRAVGGAGASRLPPGRLSRRWPPSSRRSTFARPRWSAARSRRASTRPRCVGEGRDGALGGGVEGGGLETHLRGKGGGPLSLALEAGTVAVLIPGVVQKPGVKGERVRFLGAVEDGGTVRGPDEAADDRCRKIAIALSLRLSRSSLARRTKCSSMFSRMLAWATVSRPKFVLI
jgi:hypothetical protein